MVTTMTNSTMQQQQQQQQSLPYPLQLFCRFADGIKVYQWAENKSLEESFSYAEKDTRTLKFSLDGNRIAWFSTSGFSVMDAKTWQMVFKQERTGVQEIFFSNTGHYIVTWEKYVPSTDGTSKNIHLWNVDSQSVIASWCQKNRLNWDIQWTNDDAFCARMGTNQIQIFEASVVSKPPLSTLNLENIQSFSLFTGTTDSAPKLVVFVPEKKGSAGFVRMYNSNAMESPPLSSKSFFSADKMKVKWSRSGTEALVLTQTETDRSGKSYYGETNLYYITAGGKADCKITLDKEGPIFDVAWHPSGQEFYVIYGNMPAKAAFFDRKGNQLYDFGEAPRNTISVSPHGNLVSFAGFGNLNGDIDIWDRKALKKLCTFKSGDASSCTWSADSQNLLTSTTSPKLRVDNRFTIWGYYGQKLGNVDFKELYQAEWLPLDHSAFPLKPIQPKPVETVSDVSAVKLAAPATAYRPPHSRNRPAESSGSSSVAAALNGLNKASIAQPAVAERVVPGFHRVVVGAPPKKNVPGASTTGPDGAPLSKSAAKNKKRKEKAAAAKEAELASKVSGTGLGI